MKKFIICIGILLIIIIIIFFIYKNRAIVNDNGVIIAIDTTQKTLKIDIEEREYRIPDSFVCNTFATYYMVVDTGEKTKKIRFEDLVVDQEITVKYDFLNYKVYKIIVKNYR